MTTTIARCKVGAAAARWRMGDDNSNGGTGNGGDSQLAKRFNDLSFYLISVGTVALIATSIRVWAGMDVIQTQIGALVKSDSAQDRRIDQNANDISTLRVQVGILRAITQGHNGMGRP